ncbi:hypothetical protein BKA70DRAFT_1573856 [Coprinopsis sp. MPI-PUGE-AT-0042]|nr:hypothetical protein BKA70DRAFT_1573856 [Coprinopsis sp. MPI-PUGE-AT-0042]
MRKYTDIPTEILTEIFVLALPQRLDKEGRQAFQTIRTVSSKWRLISFSSPILWSSVSVTCDHRDPFDTGSYLSHLHGWFSRAGPSISLDLEYVHLREGSMGSEDEAAMESLIRKHQSRWRSLSLFIKSLTFWDTIFCLPSSNWSNLHTLTLWSYDFAGPESEHTSRTFDALDNIASLRRLIVQDHMDYKYARRYGPINLAELYISLDDVFTTDHSRLISAYPNLTKLELVVPPFYDLELASDYHLTLPSLSTFAYSAYELTILNYFTTPALAHLEIQFNPGQSEPEDEVLVKFLTRCTSSLKSITLITRPNETLIAQVLPSLSIRQSITHLTLDLWPSVTEAEIFPEEVERNWCPKLQELTVTLEADDLVELGRMEGLSTLLLRRSDLELPDLKRLTVHNRLWIMDFPCKLFKDVSLGELRVLVPLDG